MIFVKWQYHPSSIKTSIFLQGLNTEENKCFALLREQWRDGGYANTCVQAHWEHSIPSLQEIFAHSHSSSLFHTSAEMARAKMKRLSLCSHAAASAEVRCKGLWVSGEAGVVLLSVRDKFPHYSFFYSPDRRLSVQIKFVAPIESCQLFNLMKCSTKDQLYCQCLVLK